MILGRIIALLIGYCLGMILCGYLIGKAQNVDLRKMGSGNVGTTNTLRNLGVKAGAITLCCDCLKSILAVVLAWLIFKNIFDDPHIYMLYAGCGAVLGHDFPFYMKFKGGKGIASTLGFCLAIFPMTVPIAAVVFLTAVFITRYVSLGSILGATVIGIQIVVFAQLGMLPFAGAELVEAQVIGVAICLLAVILHHANINRLIHHNENKFSFRPETRA